MHLKSVSLGSILLLATNCGEVKNLDTRSQVAAVESVTSAIGTADNNPEPIDEEAEERKRLAKKLEELLASSGEQNLALEDLKKFVADLQKLLADETDERKRADQSLQGQIDGINLKLADIDATLAKFSSRNDDVTGLFQALRAEFESQKLEYTDLRSDLAAARNEIAGQISEIHSSITELNAAFADAQSDNVENMDALRAELAAKETQFRSMITNLEQQSEATNTKIMAIQDDQTRLALEAEHSFALRIKEMAEKNQEMIQSLASQMTAIDNRIKAVEDSVAALEESVDELFDQMAVVTAGMSALDKRTKALEQFAAVGKFCAAAATGLKVLEGDLIAMQTANRTLFGPSSSSSFGYGNQFAKFNRFKKAEQLFDQYNWNLFHLNAASLQVKLLQVACSSMIAFPSRPTESGGPAIVGTTLSPIAGGPSVTWAMPTAQEVRRLLRIIPLEIQSQTTTSLNNVLTAYTNILPTGSSMNGDAWDNHFLALASLVGHGMTLVKASVSHLKANVVSNTKLLQILPNDQRSALCRFGSGTADRSDVAGLRYSSLEDGVVNNTATRWHLPQQNFYQQIGSDVYIMEYGYGLAMGPSQDAVKAQFESTAQINETDNATTLLASVETLNTFDKFPTVLERNVTTFRNKVVANIKNVCSSTKFTRDNFRGVSIARYALVPFSKINGCWNDMLSDTATLCSHIAYNPTGDASSSVPGSAKVVPVTLASTTPWTTTEPIALNEHASSGRTIIELFSDSERSKYSSDSSYQICGDAARVPSDEAVGPFKVWGNLSSPYSELDAGIFRDVTSSPTTASFIVRSCRKCDSYAYSQPIDIDGVEVPNLKLTFNPDFIFPMNSGDGSRCTLTQSRCNDFCANLAKLSGYNSKDYSGTFILYGENQSSEPSIAKSGIVTTGHPWNLDYQAMLDRDQCSCTSRPR